MDMEKRGFFFLFVTSALSSVSGAELRGRVLFSPSIQGTLGALLPEQSGPGSVRVA